MTPTDPLTAKIAEARKLDAAATDAPWRCESAHDLWREVRHGYGLSNRMVVDCALGKDGEFIAHARNHHAALWDCIEAAAGCLHNHDADPSTYGEQESDQFEDLRAALARLAQVQEADHG